MKVKYFIHVSDGTLFSLLCLNKLFNRNTCDGVFQVPE